MTDLPTIFCLNDNDWNIPWWMDRQHLVSRLAARGWPVVYSRGLLDAWDRGTGKWNRSPRFPQVSSEYAFGSSVKIYKAGKVLPLWRNSRFWNRYLYRHFCRGFLQAAHNPPPDKRIVLACSTRYENYIPLLDPKWLVFHVYDAWWDNDNWFTKNQEPLRKVVEQADLITALSPVMAESLPYDDEKKARVLRHGVDYDAFANGERLSCPEDLAKIDHPRIGYFGRVSAKIDLPLIANTAQAHPNWNWVFVGQAVGTKDGDWADEWRRIQSQPNCHILGLKETNEIPAYMAHMDVNTLPFRADDSGYWYSIFSLKTYEYFASGRPVIGADIPNHRRMDKIMNVASSEQEWESCIENVLSNGGVGSKEVRLNAAKENSWEHRADQLDQWLREMISDSSSSPSLH